MKTIKIITSVIAFVMLFNVAKADNPVLTVTEEGSPYKTMMTNEIKELVGYPDFAIMQEIQGFVLVSFNYNEKGELVILDANSNSELLKTYVIEKLKLLNMCTHAKTPERKYNLRFDFQLI